MSRLLQFTVLIVALVVAARYLAPWQQRIVETRRNPHWQVIEEDLKHAGQEALRWADETVREKLGVEPDSQPADTAAESAAGR